MAHQPEREEIEHKKFVDYKDVQYLRMFMRARYMALLPYLAA